MTNVTTLHKLIRFKEMADGEALGKSSWWTNPKGHPRPTLPEQSYLEGPYLSIVERSCPDQIKIARELVEFAGKERKG